MIEITPHISILYVHLLMRESQSLKDKRMILRRLKDKVRAQFNVSMAELDGQDKWQRSLLGFSMIGGDKRYMDQTMQNLLSFIESLREVEISDHSLEFC